MGPAAAFKHTLPSALPLLVAAAAIHLPSSSSSRPLLPPRPPLLLLVLARWRGAGLDPATPALRPLTCVAEGENIGGGGGGGAGASAGAEEGSGHAAVASADSPAAPQQRPDITPLLEATAPTGDAQLPSPASSSSSSHMRLPSSADEVLRRIRVRGTCGGPPTSAAAPGNKSSISRVLMRRGATTDGSPMLS